jgi:hypothetical protein
MSDTKISDLTLLPAVLDDDLLVVVDVHDTSMSASGTTKKALKSQMKGDKGDTGLTGPTGPTGATGADGSNGVNAFVYVAYASDSSGTDFTMTFNANLNYIAVKNTTIAIVSPQASDFVGLWKNYKGATGTNGTNGATGPQGPTGADGLQGPKGDTGATGPQGPRCCWKRWRSTSCCCFYC